MHTEMIDDDDDDDDDIIKSRPYSIQVYLTVQKGNDHHQQDVMRWECELNIAMIQHSRSEYAISISTPLPPHRNNSFA
jgi:hypothetical protein